MKIKIPKPYIFIGTLVTTGVIITISYNIITADNAKEVVSINNQSEPIKQIDYSNEILEIKQRLTNVEEEIELLKEKDKILEESNTKQDETINNLKVQESNPSDTIGDLKKQLKNNQDEIEKTKSDLQNVKNVINKRYKRLNEIQDRLSETAKLPQNYKRIELEINKLKTEEQTEEVIEKIKQLEIKYEQAKKISNEVTELNNEMRELLFGEISL